jgi:hypothetical protein
LTKSARVLAIEGPTLYNSAAHEGLIGERANHHDWLSPLGATRPAKDLGSDALEISRLTMAGVDSPVEIMSQVLAP